MPIRIGILGNDPPENYRYAAYLEAQPDVERVGNTDSEHLLKTGNLDAVILCAGRDRHRELVETAAANHTAVLCECPLATDLADARAMVAACERDGAALFTTLPYRFHPAYRRLRQTVQQGELGTLIGARVGHSGCLPEERLVDKRIADTESAWYRAVPMIDLLRDLSGAEPIDLHAVRPGIALFTVTFDSGLFATLDCGNAPSSAFGSEDAIDITLTGTGGTAELDLFAQNHTIYPVGESALRRSNWGDDIHCHVIDAFVATLRSSAISPALVSGADWLRAARFLHTASTPD